MSLEHATWPLALLITFSVACGSTEQNANHVAGGAGGTDAGVSTAGSGDTGGLPFGYGDNGYGFGGYGQTGWAGQANTGGTPPVGAAGFGGSTAAEACASYQPPAALNADRLDSCDAVTAAYEFQDAKLGIASS